jgi:hypothetical protein
MKYSLSRSGWLCAILGTRTMPKSLLIIWDLVCDHPRVRITIFPTRKCHQLKKKHAGRLNPGSAFCCLKSAFHLGLSPSVPNFGRLDHHVDWFSDLFACYLFEFGELFQQFLLLLSDFRSQVLRFQSQAPGLRMFQPKNDSLFHGRVKL